MDELLPTPPVPEIEAAVYQPYQLAVILNGKVHHSMSVDESLAGVLLAQPTFVQHKRGEAFPGDTYENGKFIPTIQ